MKQYELLSKCIRDLKDSKMPAEKKLLLELLFIQTKVVLLTSEVESRVRGDATSEQEFYSLYERVRQVCESGRETEMDQLIGHLEKLKQGLKDTSIVPRSTTKRYRGLRGLCKAD
jgi:hypothetical protein